VANAHVNQAAGAVLRGRLKSLATLHKCPRSEAMLCSMPRSSFVRLFLVAWCILHASRRNQSCPPSS
jgi:hypothetical protein